MNGWWDLENHMVLPVADDDLAMEPGEIPYTDEETSERFLEPDEYEIARQEEIDAEAERQAGVDCHDAILGIALFMGAWRQAESWLAPPPSAGCTSIAAGVARPPISTGDDDE